MIRRTLLPCVFAIVAVVLVSPSAGLGQDSGVLSGKWVFAPEKSQGKPTVFRVFNTTGVPAGSDMEITQTASAMNVRIAAVNLVYRLDGTEGSVSAEGKAGFPIGKAVVSGNKMTANLTQEVFAAAKGNYVKVPVVEVYTVSDGLLTLERTVTKPDGTTATQKLVYTKSP